MSRGGAVAGSFTVAMHQRSRASLKPVALRTRATALEYPSHALRTVSRGELVPSRPALRRV
jgi:hypothetical protein